MKLWLCKIGFWFLKRGGWDLQIIDMLSSMPKVERKLIARAKALSEMVNKVSAAGTSGEYKRHVVYAALMKEFPEMTHRQIAMAIEIGLG